MGGMARMAAGVAAFLSLSLGWGVGSAQAAALREALVVEAVARAASVKHGVPRADVVVRWADRPASALAVGMPEGPVSVEVYGAARLNGVGPVGVSVDVAGKRWRTLFPKLEVQVMVPAVVALAPIARGSLVQASQVAVAKAPLPSNGMKPAVALAGIVGAEALRDVAVGEALVATQFRLVPAVRAGEMVSVTLQSGGLSLVSNGQARSAGAVGSTVRVVLLATRKELMAKVIGPGKVLIELEEAP